MLVVNIPKHTLHKVVRYS